MVGRVEGGVVAGTVALRYLLRVAVSRGGGGGICHASMGGGAVAGGGGGAVVVVVVVVVVLSGSKFSRLSSTCSTWLSSCSLRLSSEEE